MWFDLWNKKCHDVNRHEDIENSQIIWSYHLNLFIQYTMIQNLEVLLKSFNYLTSFQCHSFELWHQKRQTKDQIEEKITKKSFFLRSFAALWPSQRNAWDKKKLPLSTLNNSFSCWLLLANEKKQYRKNPFLRGVCWLRQYWERIKKIGGQIIYFSVTKI